MSLPVEKIIPELLSALDRGSSVILKAPPGAGKTTLVPPALLGEPWLQGRKIIVLEPRRLAARAAAYRMSENLGDEVGKTVGYRTRTDTLASRGTRIEVVTEGIFTRMILRNPELGDVAAVIFDEFHERSIHSDLGLALALDAKSAIREDLRIIIMSATLDPEKISPILDNPQTLSCEGRTFDVMTDYHHRAKGEKLEDSVLRALSVALSDGARGVLCFLPGVGEIRRTEQKIRASGLLSGDIVLSPLYGDLDKRSQDAAIRPAPAGQKKIILATSIAESSITIDGITAVIDSGLSRKSVFDHRTGMSHLETARSSLASAEQRRGRAGRTAPGICHRLWGKAEDNLRPEYDRPEILESDLADLALSLADWGTSDPKSLKWLDPPPSAQFAQSVELLKELGALESSGRITAHGRKMLSAGTHPRLANMIIRAEENSLGPLACDIAAVMEEKDFLKFSDSRRNSDIRIRLEILKNQQIKDRGDTLAGQNLHGCSAVVDNSAKSRIERLADDFRKRMGIKAAGCDIGKAGVLLGFAYPDRIARRREGREPVYLLSCGRSAKFAELEPLSRDEFLVISDLDDKDKDARIFLAAPLSRKDIDHFFADITTKTETVEWDGRNGMVAATGKRLLGKIVLEEYPLRNPDHEKVAEAVLDGIRKGGLSLLPWDLDTENLRSRIQFAAQIEPAGDWPDTSDEALLKNIALWLSPYLKGIRRLDDFRKICLKEALEGMLSHSSRGKLEKLFPARLKVASGSTIRLDYTGGKGPVLAVKVQELFGTAEHPAIFAGKIPVTIKILSPSMRPVQTTSDLPGFWKSSYSLVKKDLRGRYPKHYWPDNPLESSPCRGTRPAQAAGGRRK